MSTRKAIRTPSDINGSGWYRLLPEPPPPKVLQGRLTADWVVIGAGFFGLAAARRLAQLVPGERIVVLEAQRVGWGAAGRNSGFMIDLPHDIAHETYASGVEHDRREIRMNRVGLAFAAEAAEEYGLADIFRPVGKYHGAATPHGLKVLLDFENHLTSLGESFEHVDADAMRRVTGTPFYVGGTFTPGTTMIQPAAYVRAVAAGLGDSVDIFENSPVTAIETGTERVVKTAGGEVRTPRLIMANNGQIESFGYFRHRLMHIFTFSTMTRRLSADEMAALGGEERWGLIPADPMGSTVRRYEDRIIVRNNFTYNPDMRTSEQQIAAIGRDHDKSFAARFPMLKGVTPEHRWGGHLCLSLNAVPAFGEIEDRVYAAACCNGLGTVKGTLYGKLIAELAVGHPEPMLEDALADPAPQKLYPEPLMTWGAKAKLWWMQQRAGREL